MNYNDRRWGDVISAVIDDIKSHLATSYADGLADGRKQGMEEAAKVVERETENTEWADLAKEIRALKEEA